MSNPRCETSSRCLRLERLEDRSLLAGGLLAVGFAEFMGGHDGFERLDRTHANRFDGNRQPADEFRAETGQRTPFDRQFDPRRSAQDGQSAQSTPNEALTQALTSVVIPSPPRRFVESAQQAVTPNLPDARPPETRPPASVIDVALAAINEPSNDSAVEVDDRLTGSIAAEVSTIEPADRPERVSSSEPRTNSALTTPDAITFQSSEPAGTLDLTPLLQSQPFQRSELPDKEPWELDRSILPRLKQAIEVTPGELAQIADKVVTEWFSGPGGMVALDQVQLPSGLFILDNAVVDIQLESSLLLYRSLDLFATSTSTQFALPMSGPISDQALDAIMATLGALAKSESQPVDRPSPFKMPTLVYPATAILATTIAISNRRKHKPSTNLQATQPR